MNSHQSRSRRSRHRPATLALALAVAVAAAACAGGDDEVASPPTDDTTTTAADTTAVETTAVETTAVETTEVATTVVETTDVATTAAATTAAPTTAAPTTAAPTTATPPTVAPTTTLVPEIARMPLTGRPLGFAELPPDRPALVVKIDNVGAGRPQTGLNQADIVFEEIVEGRQTRFAAVFHSLGANPVGPIRSGRTQDVDLLSGLNQPLFVWSGGNAGVVRAIEESGFISLNNTGRPPASGFFRTGRKAPHNLFNNTDPLWQQVTMALGRPTALFQYVEPGAPLPLELRSFVEVQMGTNPVRWDWDPGSGSYLRAQGGGAHQLTDGRASANNVVVMVTSYRPSSVDARSPEAITVGSGFAFVFTGGYYHLGVWERADRFAPITLRTPEGAPIELLPGRTWVELADASGHDTQSG
ncbi:MAG: DUF3048 domain-containing protein [Actinomycetota bacterium]|nr:DUF3048 domain-containing protein [Actinomycetota bacterium]